MDLFRLKHSIGLCLQKGPRKRSDYLRKHKVFRKVGEYSFFNPRVIPLYPELISIGNNTCIASQVTFCTHDAIHFLLRKRFPKEKWNEMKGEIIIGDNCFIGTRSVILPGVIIGNDCIIAAGSIVTKNVPSGEIWGGNPAHKIGDIDVFVEKRKLV